MDHAPSTDSIFPTNTIYKAAIVKLWDLQVSWILAFDSHMMYHIHSQDKIHGIQQKHNDYVISPGRRCIMFLIWFHPFKFTPTLFSPLFYVASYI